MAVARPICPICANYGYVDGDVIRCRYCFGVSMIDRDTTAIYDEQYVADRYDKYDTTRAMSELRLQVITDALQPYGDHGMKLLDVGYGNGDFIRTATAAGWDAYGHDVNPTQYDGVRNVPLPIGRNNKRYDVVTFFDSLEHFEDLRDVRDIRYRMDYIVVSFPSIPTTDLQQWKHYRPGEHHFHFMPLSLQLLFSQPNVQVACPVYIGHPEDAIRGTLPNGEPNITTIIMKMIDL
jgi:hypothetical protein